LSSHMCPYISGLDNAGKSTLCYLLTSRLHGTPPTRYDAKKTLVYNNIKLTLIDGGQRRRVYPRHNYKHIDVVLFMVDSNDRDRIQEAQAELRLDAQDEALKNTPFLVLANKQDLPAALTAPEVAEAMDFQEILKAHRANIIGCSILSRSGIKDALDWLTQEFQSPCKGSKASSHKEEIDEAIVGKREAWSIFTYIRDIFEYLKRYLPKLK
ncbi:uncharacterized protein, partial [Haliotis cracherodii]|uniref:uncharacterized protein n=1 Tax=Haliotis cracherodii TaxID=6455 RepID=UPI0039EB39D4